MEPIEAALERIATLLQQQLDQASAHMEEVRVRDAEFKADNEAWKEEMRSHYQAHEAIEQERLALERASAARIEAEVKHSVANQEQMLEENARQAKALSDILKSDDGMRTIIHHYVHDKETPWRQGM